MKHRNLRILTSAALIGVVALAAACGSDKEGSLLDDGDSGGSNNGSGGTKGNGATGNIIIPIGGEGTVMPSEGGANCGFTNLTAAPLEVNVLLVVDKSASMNEPAESPKWPQLQEALQATLEATEERISFGLDLYPYSGKSGAALSGECQMPDSGAIVVPVQAGTKARPLILAALQDNDPSGGTPTAAALARAYDYYTTGAGKSLKGAKYVLLATDGGPNCSADPEITCEAEACTTNIDGLDCGGNCCDPKKDPDGPAKCLDDAASIQAVADLADKGIKTFVIGIPGTEAYAATLDALAEESGVENPDAPPSYFAVSAQDGVEGLTSVLTKITTGLITSCKLQLEEDPPNINDVFVVVDGELIERDDADGWAQSDPVTSPPTIVLQGATCEKLETEGAGYINVSYGCPNYDPPK
jgi:hypothetical protein